MPQLTRALSYLAALAVLPAMAPAQEPPPERVARLIRELGADSYRAREQAGRELAQLGASSREQLEQARRSPDPEISLRAADLLRRLELDDLWRPALVTIDCRQEKLSKAIEQINAQCSNHVRAGTRFESCNDATIDASFESANYWQALDALCRLTNNRLRPHYDARDRGVVVAAGSPGSHPTAYAGPVRLEMMSCRRIYDDELHYKQLELKRQHSFRLSLSAVWEDRLELIAYAAQPRVVAARTDTGEELLPVEANHDWNVVGRDSQQLSVDLKLQPPALAAQRLETLLLSWNLIAIGARQQIEMVLNSDSVLRQDGREFRLISSQAKSETLHEIVVLTAYDHVLSEPIEAVFQENRYELVDADGRAWNLIDQHHELEGEGVKSRLTFRRESTKPSTPTAIRVNYPRLRSERSLDAMFHDVPLPKSLVSG